MKFLSTTAFFLLFPFLLNAQNPPEQWLLAIISNLENQYYDTSYQADDWENLRRNIAAAPPADFNAAQRLLDSLFDAMNEPTLQIMDNRDFELMMEEATAAEHVGIGLVAFQSVDIDPLSGETKIISPVVGSPAAKAGLRANDVVRFINGKSLEGLYLFEVMRLLRVPKGDKVTIAIERDGKLKDFSIAAAAVQPPQSPFYKIIKVKDRKIGCIWFPAFSTAAAPQFMGILTEFKKQGVTALLLDLRGNASGNLREVQRIGGLCFGNKKMGETEGLSNYLRFQIGLEKAVCDLPMVVLIDQATANTAELLAGALQFHQRATLVGERTHGKGLVLSFVPFADGTVFSLPVGRIRLPNGRDLQTQGVQPDILVKNKASFRFGDRRKDLQFKKAIEILEK